MSRNGVVRKATILRVTSSGCSMMTKWVAPGTVLTGSFSVSGDTTITAYVRTAAGQVVRHLGSFAVQEGNLNIGDLRDPAYAKRLLESAARVKVEENITSTLTLLYVKVPSSQ